MISYQMMSKTSFMKPANQFVLITGGSEGIGFELAKVFAENNHNLVLVARDEEKLNQAADQLRMINNVEVITISKDLFYPGNAFELYDEIVSEDIQVEILVNNAGQGQYGEFADTEINRLLDIINLNISSLVTLTNLFLKNMIDLGAGRILNLSSVASKSPGPLNAVYHGTKAFVQSFTEAVREEVKDKGITVTALLPGATDTGFFEKADMLDSKIVQEDKLGDPAQVAKDGYDALMSGKDKVISGFKNKMQVAMANALPEKTVAKQIHKQQGPASKVDNE
jgi:short-subunit dehydrogenase